MKGIILPIEQGSTEWLALRKSKITGTDAAKIMGLNPWVKEDALLEEKLGLRETSFKNDKMDKGTELEPIARNLINHEMMTDFQPVVMQHATEDWAMASLDGLNSKGEMLEIKCGEKAYEDALKGIIPKYYMAQMQHCLWVTDSHSCIYASFNPNNMNEKIIINIMPDPVFIQKMITKEKLFYTRWLEFDIPDKKYYVQQDSKRWRMLVELYNEADKEEKLAKLKKEAAKKELLTECDYRPSEGFGIRLSKHLQRGRIDYSCIPELKDIDLDAYRSKSTEVWRIDQNSHEEK